MQAASVRPVPTAPVRAVHAVRAASATAAPSVTGALRAVERLLLGAGQRTARRNAWTAVLEDRSRARDRVEAQHVLEAVAERAARAT
jgi:hypothetical protein